LEGIKTTQHMGTIHSTIHHFAEVVNPNGICLATLLTEPNFVSVRGVFKVLVNVTVIALVLCSLPEFDILYLLNPPY